MSGLAAIHAMFLGMAAPNPAMSCDYYQAAVTPKVNLALQLYPSVSRRQFGLPDAKQPNQFELFYWPKSVTRQAEGARDYESLDLWARWPSADTARASFARTPTWTIAINFLRKDLVDFDLTIIADGKLLLRADKAWVDHFRTYAAFDRNPDKYGAQVRLSDHLPSPLGYRQVTISVTGRDGQLLLRRDYAIGKVQHVQRKLDKAEKAIRAGMASNDISVCQIHPRD